MISINGREVKIEHFPDGTQRLNIKEIIDDAYSLNYKYHIAWRYEKEEEMSTLIYITRHLRNIPRTSFMSLHIPYIPNARMDRIHDQGEVFTLKSFADVINWLQFDEVFILDPHSNVSESLIDRCQKIDVKHIIQNVINQIERDDSELVLYFPDAGAAKRYADMFPKYKYCYGEKERDWDTGKIKRLNIRLNNINLLEDKTVLMIDDIISYGGSLYYSALALNDKRPKHIYAYATHTENSVLDPKNGTLIKLLNDGTVETLFTTNSIYNSNHEKISVANFID